MFIFVNLNLNLTVPKTLAYPGSILLDPFHDSFHLGQQFLFRSLRGHRSGKRHKIRLIITFDTEFSLKMHIQYVIKSQFDKFVLTT